MTTLDERIRTGFAPVDVTDVDRERMWRGALNWTEPARPSRARRWRAPRTLIIAAVAAASVASIAVAQPGPIDKLIGRRDDANRMSVYRDTKPVQHVPSMVRRMVEMTPSRTGLGSVDPANVHQVIEDDDGSYRVTVLSGPSADGQACMYVEVYDLRRHMPRSGGGGCSLAMRYNGHVTVSTEGDIRFGTMVIGLADDAVTGVRVHLSDGRTVASKMGHNGFLLRQANPNIHPVGLLVDLENGRTLDVTMSGCLRSQLQPPTRTRLGCGFGMNQGPKREVR